jgi:hypothetical protein
LTPRSGILDSEWVKKQDPDPKCSTRIIFPRAWKQIFLVKILKLFDGDPGWKKSDPGWKTFGSEIRDKHPEFPTLTIMEKMRNFMF